MTITLAPAWVRQRLDVVPELEVGALRGGEGEVGAGGDVVDVLGHRAALVRAVRAVLEHVDVARQVAR